MLKVVDGSLLIGTVEGADDEHFYGCSGRRTEEEYRRLLEDSQSYFNGIADGTIDKTENYYIYAPQDFLTLGIATGIAKSIIGMEDLFNARKLYVDEPICVKECDKGYAYSGDNGRHRFAIAQKYGLRLLVNVI